MLRRWMGAAIAFTTSTALAGCAWGESDASRSQALEQSRLTLGASYAYVADFEMNAVRVYDANLPDPPPILTITQGLHRPLGLAVDKSGTLYVANTDPPSIAEFAWGETRSKLTITSGITQPGFPAVDPQGNLWVPNWSPGNVVEYKAGDATPARTLTNGIADPKSVAFDRNGDLFVGNVSWNGKPYIAMFPPQSTKPSAKFGLGALTYPNGIATDPSGNIFAANYPSGDVLAFDHRTHALIRTVTPEFQVAGGEQIALDPMNLRLYVACGPCWPRQPYVAEVAEYGRGTLLSNSIRSDLGSAVGVAIYPPMVP